MHCTKTIERLLRNKKNYIVSLQAHLLSEDRDKTQCFQTAVLEGFVALTTQLMSTLDTQFTGILMLKIADLELFTAWVLISPGAAEPLKEKTST